MLALIEALLSALSIAPQALFGALAGGFAGFQFARGPGAIVGFVFGLLCGLTLDVTEHTTARKMRLPFLIVTVAILAVAGYQWQAS